MGVAALQHGAVPDNASCYRGCPRLLLPCWGERGGQLRGRHDRRDRITASLLLRCFSREEIPPRLLHSSGIDIAWCSGLKPSCSTPVSLAGMSSARLQQTPRRPHASKRRLPINHLESSAFPSILLMFKCRHIGTSSTWRGILRPPTRITQPRD